MTELVSSSTFWAAIVASIIVAITYVRNREQRYIPATPRQKAIAAALLLSFATTSVIYYTGSTMLGGYEASAFKLAQAATILYALWIITHLQIVKDDQFRPD